MTVAQSEIGANRKHRGNRLLTVIQYAMDMAECFAEFARVLSPDGKVIMTIGRESNVRGLTFRNGEILGAVAIGLGFSLVRRQERRFTNRFGVPIWEELLTLSRPTVLPEAVVEVGRAVGVLELEAARGQAVAEDVVADVGDALARRAMVHSSPLLS